MLSARHCSALMRPTTYKKFWHGPCKGRRRKVCDGMHGAPVAPQRCDGFASPSPTSLGGDANCSSLSPRGMEA